MQMREGKCGFLTEIAKGYDSRIMVVSFLPLSVLPDMAGMVWKPKPPDDDGLLRIEIDTNKLICVHQIFHIFFHEVGHVVLGHCDPTPIIKTPELETEAKDWAFRQTGMIDGNGQVKQVNEACYYCIDQRAKTYLKGFNLQGGKNE